MQAGTVKRCFLRANIGSVVTGDEVVWRDSTESGNNGVIVATEERKSALYRPDARGALRPVAANIDRIFIVVAPEPEPFANLIDRYLVAAENQHIEAILVLNKCDLLNGESGEAVQQLVAPYEKLGYKLLTLSAKQTEDGGLESLPTNVGGIYQRICRPVWRRQILPDQCPVTQCQYRCWRTLRSPRQRHPHHHHCAAVSPKPQ